MAQSLPFDPLMKTGALPRNFGAGQSSNSSSAPEANTGFAYAPIMVPGSSYTSVYGDSNTGYVAGSYTLSDGTTTGFIASGSTSTSITYLGSTTTVCSSVNSSLLTVGYTLTNGGSELIGFSYQNGTFSEIIPPGAQLAVAFAVNDSGVIGGYYVDSNGVQHGFLYDGTSYTTIDIPNETNAVVFGINNLGVYTVQAQNSAGNIDSFVVSGTSVTLRDVPGAVNSYIHGLNEAGSLSYSFQTVSGGSYSSAIFVRGNFINVAYPGASDTYADDINSSNLVVGNTDFLSNGTLGAFRAHPSNN